MKKVELRQSLRKKKKGGLWRASRPEALGVEWKPGECLWEVSSPAARPALADGHGAWHLRASRGVVQTPRSCSTGLQEAVPGAASVSPSPTLLASLTF